MPTMLGILLALLLVAVVKTNLTVQPTRLARWQWLPSAGHTNEERSEIVTIERGPSGSVHPGSRKSAALTYSDLTGQIYLFGGHHRSHGRMLDLWSYDPETKAWMWLDTSGNSTGSAEQQLGERPGKNSAPNHYPGGISGHRFISHNGGSTHVLYGGSQNLIDQGNGSVEMWELRLIPDRNWTLIGTAPDSGLTTSYLWWEDENGTCAVLRRNNMSFLDMFEYLSLTWNQTGNSTGDGPTNGSHAATWMTGTDYSGTGNVVLYAAMYNVACSEYARVWKYDWVTSVWTKEYEATSLLGNYSSDPAIMPARCGHESTFAFSTSLYRDGTPYNVLIYGLGHGLQGDGVGTQDVQNTLWGYAYDSGMTSGGWQFVPVTSNDPPTTALSTSPRGNIGGEQYITARQDVAFVQTCHGSSTYYVFGGLGYDHNETSSGTYLADMWRLFIFAPCNQSFCMDDFRLAMCNSDGYVHRRPSCEYGCKNDSAASRCYERLEHLANCTFSFSECVDNEDAYAECLNGRIVVSQCPTYGCKGLEGKCYTTHLETGAKCSISLCKNATNELHTCTGGKMDAAIVCEAGCVEGNGTTSAACTPTNPVEPEKSYAMYIGIAVAAVVGAGLCVCLIAVIVIMGCIAHKQNKASKEALANQPPRPDADHRSEEELEDVPTEPEKE